MSLKVAFQMDPMDKINPAMDSTFLLMLEAQRRGYKLFHYTPDALSLENQALRAWAHPVKVAAKGKKHYSFGKPQVLDLGKMDVVFLRQDPPFDMAYITTTYLLERIKDRVLIVNDPASVRDCPEKIFVKQFADLMPPTLISSNIDEINRFRKKHGDIVLKPLFAKGGAHVVHLDPQTRNLGSLLGMFNDINPGEPVMAQKYLKEIRRGSKRIVLINGEAYGGTSYIPAAHENRASPSLGGKMVKSPLTKREKQICAILKPELQKRGLLFAGIDVIGDYLIEINVTSPAGIVSINRFYDLRLDKILWDHVESLVH